MWLKEAYVNFSSHVKINISHNGNKGVVNCIMGFGAFIAMSAM
jgi:ribose 5-phosphate isomerase RpiB